MGFRLKVFPGARVRVSSRRVRVGLGPRIGRVHVGTGRTGVSSGLGPFSAYFRLGRKRRRKSKDRSHGRGAVGTKRNLQAPSVNRVTVRPSRIQTSWHGVIIRG
jgi:hypothetical protein